MEQIKPSVLATPKGNVDKFARLLETLTAQTDCGACGYPTCYEYTTAMAAGADYDPSKCEPGGAEATADLGYAMDVYWKGPEAADAAAKGQADAPGVAPAVDGRRRPAPAGPHRRRRRRRRPGLKRRVRSVAAAPITTSCRPRSRAPYLNASRRSTNVAAASCPPSAQSPSSLSRR